MMSAPILYRITNWDSIYENNRTRELKKLDWVPVPNKQDGDGYTMVVSHEQGPAIFGAWNAVLQIASRGSHPAGRCGNPAPCCECRGVLLRQGGKPHDSASLSRMTRIPETVIQLMLDICSSEDVGWLTKATYENPAGGCGDPPPPEPHNPAGGCLEGKGMEGNLFNIPAEPNPTPKTQRLCLQHKDSPAVKPEDIYAAYPKKAERPNALREIEKAFKEICPACLLERVKHFASLQVGADPHYIPYPAKWFSQQRYNDDFSTWTQAKPNNSSGKPVVNRNLGTYNESVDPSIYEAKAR